MRQFLRTGILKLKRRNVLKVEAQEIGRLNLVSLTDNEARAFSSLWKPLGIHVKPLYFKLFKTLEYYDPKFVPDDIFFPYILRSLNDINHALAYENKGMYQHLFQHGPLQLPRTIVTRIRGAYYNAAMQVVNRAQALELLKQEDEFIIKPTSDSCMGRNVMKVSQHEHDLEILLQQYGDDFIAQEVIRQSSQTKCFNPTSLNTFRISTLYLNGQASLCSIIFRSGKSGAVVDNGGAGGIMVGVDKQGIMRDYGYDAQYNKCSVSHSGQTFKNYVVPNMTGIVESVLTTHQTFLPQIGFAGWDIALAANNEPVLIEVNLSIPGIQFEQLCPAVPIFGSRTEEVIDYVCHHVPQQIVHI